MAAERLFFVEGGAGRLLVSDGGAGEPAVVFVHGLGSSLEAWRAQLDRLRPARRAVAFDQRGHGGSDRARDAVYTIDALARDLHAVVTRLSLGRFFLVGHSLSGAVITAYAAVHGEAVSGLVYADAVGDLRALPPGSLDEAVRREASPGFGAAERDRAFSEMLGPAARPSTRERVLAWLARLDPPAYAALRRDLSAFEVGRRLAAYRGPILAIEAEGADVPVLASRTIAGASRVGLPAVSHWLMMDDPGGFDRALLPFLGLGTAGD